MVKASRKRKTKWEDKNVDEELKLKKVEKRTSGRNKKNGKQEKKEQCKIVEGKKENYY